MSGHSKFANIKHKKEKNDAAKGKIFTIIGREIAVAVKEGGPDPSNNFKLATVIAKAKANGKHSICLTSGGIQKDVGLKNRLPLVCNAMRKCMDEKSVVIYETPSGQSSTFAVQWNF